MHRDKEFHQAEYVGNLALPNNEGVCLSLSIHWLVNQCDDDLVVTLVDAANQNYAVGAQNRASQVQEAGNLFRGEGVEPNTFFAIVLELYPEITNFHCPLNPKGKLTAPKVKNANTLETEMRQALYDANLIWLMGTYGNAKTGRGHVVAYQRSLNRFFDAGTGFYSAEQNGDFPNDIARYLDAQYQYYYFRLISLLIA